MSNFSISNWWKIAVLNTLTPRVPIYLRLLQLSQPVRTPTHVILGCINGQASLIRDLLARFKVSKSVNVYNSNCSRKFSKPSIPTLTVAKLPFTVPVINSLTAPVCCYTLWYNFFPPKLNKYKHQESFPAYCMYSFFELQ
jgi:hypothetical protein